jgi:hypothetical protein
VSKALELPEETKEKLKELQALSERAEEGDRAARQELRRVLRSSSPEIVARCSDFSRRGQWLLVKTISAGEPLMEEALSRRLDLMREELAGENPLPLEVLLVERIVSTWLIVELHEMLLNCQLQRGEDVPRVPPSYLKFVLGWLESYHRRLLGAIKALAQVRRLQSGMPNSQTNIQVNLSDKTT